MRKILSLLVAAVLCCSLVSTAFAASGDYTFSVQTEGSPAVGDTITVTLSLSKSGAGEFDLYARIMCASIPRTLLMWIRAFRYIP